MSGPDMTNDVTAPRSALVVDDDRAIRALVCAVLKRQGFAVHEAVSGRDAIARIEQQDYDLLLLDLMMSNGSGEDVLDVLRIRRPSAKCVIVISAASAAKIDAIDSPNVFAKLRKPFDIHELLTAVQTCAAAE